MGKKNFQNVTFYIPFKKPSTGKRKRDSENIVKFTKVQKKYNKKIKYARARVESPFRLIKKNFIILSKPWAEEEEQLDSLVWIAIGVHNIKIN